MSALLERLREEAKQLSTGERLALGTELIGLNDIADAETAANEQAWNEEILRRVEDIENGKVEMIPMEQVFSELDESLRCRRQ
jgi:putative addiction module component (TIGR02574 family)